MSQSAEEFSYDPREIVFLDGDLLLPNPRNPRGELTDADVAEFAEQLRVEGEILQPLVVTPLVESSGAGVRRYLIVVGHRRHRAGGLAGFLKFPCIIRDIPEEKQHRMMLIENVQREDLNPLQEGLGYKVYADRGDRVADIARMVGRPSIRVSQRLLIASFPLGIGLLFARLELPVSAAEPMSKIESEEDLRLIAGMIVSRQLSVDKIEQLIRKQGAGSKGPRRNFARQGVRPARPKGPVRDELVAALTLKADEPLTVGDLLREMDFVCCACGMCDTKLSQETLCSACPLMQFLNRFGGGLIESRAGGQLRVAPDVKEIARSGS